MNPVADMVDVRHGTQSKRLFTDPDIYALEMERIFGRCWLFLAHECSIPSPGDYVAAKMGEDDVLVVRQADGSIRAFLNFCRHRGAQVCAAEAGNARSFVCTYHGWSYGIDGSLRAVPFEKELYKGCLDKTSHGLAPVARVETYHGFIYGCFDANAPSLVDYLGEMRWYLDIWMQATGGVELVGPPARTRLRCNWKVPSENFVGDAYHVGWTHAAALKVVGGPLAVLSGNAVLPPVGAGRQVTTRHGHGVGILYEANLALMANIAGELAEWQAHKRPRIEQALGALRGSFYGAHLNSTLFPNNSYLWGTNVFKVWSPRGPEEIEIFTWAIVEKDMPEELKLRVAREVHRTFGAAGIFEADDSDNMETVTRLNHGWQTRKYGLNSQMGLGEDREDPDLPGVVGPSAVGETSYRGFYRFYREIMGADSWDTVRRGDATWKDELIDGRAATGAAAAIG